MTRRSDIIKIFCRKEPHKRHIVDPTAKPALCGIFDSNGAGLASAHV